MCLYLSLNERAVSRTHVLNERAVEEKGITQIWQDEKIDESFSQTNAYVCNRRQPRIEWLYEIASLLDVETKNLLVNNQEIKK